MRSPGSLVAAFALFAGACAPGVSGRVVDAASGEPIAGAVVELSNVGWGSRDGQVVWDAAKVARTTTDNAGQFAFVEDGGIALRVVTDRHSPLETSLCSRSPMLVRVGGPASGQRADRRLLFGPAEEAAGTPAEDLGLRASGSAFEGGTALRVEAAGGLVFVAGTGAIPAPPRSGWAASVDLDVVRDCGWLFVHDGAAPVAAIQVAAPGMEQDPGGAPRYVMLFAPLPG